MGKKKSNKPRRGRGALRFRLRAGHFALLTPHEDWWGKSVLKRNPFHEILYVVRGKLPVWLETGWFDVGPGELVYFGPRLPHRTRGTGKTELEFFTVSWEEPGRSYRRRRPRTWRDEGGRILSLLRWMWDLVHGDEEAAPLLDTLLQAVVLGSLEGDFSYPDSVTGRVIRFMRANLGGRISLYDMAQIAGVGREHLIRLFAKEIGVTPGRYLRRLRVEKAVNFLRSTRMPLKRIAEECGLSSASYLSRMLKQQTGEPPGDIRRRG